MTKAPDKIYHCNYCNEYSGTARGLKIHMSAKHPERKGKGGRPPAITDDVVRKLREAYKTGASDVEACSYADIGRTTLHHYKKSHPDFANRIEVWQQQTKIRSRITVSRDVGKNVQTAKWYLERKAKDEFSRRQENLNANYNANGQDESSEDKAKRATARDVAANFQKIIPSGLDNDNSGVQKYNNDDDQ